MTVTIIAPTGRALTFYRIRKWEVGERGELRIFVDSKFLEGAPVLMQTVAPGGWAGIFNKEIYERHQQPEGWGDDLSGVQIQTGSPIKPTN